METAKSMFRIRCQMFRKPNCFTIKRMAMARFPLKFLLEQQLAIKPTHGRVTKLLTSLIVVNKRQWIQAQLRNIRMQSLFAVLLCRHKLSPWIQEVFGKAQDVTRLQSKQKVLMSYPSLCYRYSCCAYCCWKYVGLLQYYRHWGRVK